MLTVEEIDWNKLEYKEIWWVAVVIEVKAIVENSRSQISFIIENEVKPWKTPWQLSIPFWTIEEDDKLPINTAVREVKEELWLEIDKSLFQQKWELTMYVNTEEGKIKVNIYVFHVLLSEKPNFKNNNSKEIRDIFLMDTSKLVEMESNKIRPWTKESLEIIEGHYEEISISVKDWLYS